jgi:hypothetical protein
VECDCLKTVAPPAPLLYIWERSAKHRGSISARFSDFDKLCGGVVGQRRSKTRSTTVNIAALAAIPLANVAIKVMTNPGALLSCRRD